MSKHSNTLADRINTQPPTKTVNQISAHRLHVTPRDFSKVIVHKKSKKPNWLAIHLLAQIIYWYTKTEVIEESTGRLLGYCRKFKSDKLQMSYATIMEQMGCTAKEAAAALESIIESKLVTKELRNIPGYNNVMFIEPVVEKIVAIIHPQAVDKYTKKRNPSPPTGGEPPHPQGGTPPHPQGGTNTLSTNTLTSTKTNNVVLDKKVMRMKTKRELNKLVKARHIKENELDRIYNEVWAHIEKRKPNITFENALNFALKAIREDKWGTPYHLTAQESKQREEAYNAEKEQERNDALNNSVIGSLFGEQVFKHIN